MSEHSRLTDGTCHCVVCDGDTNVVCQLYDDRYGCPGLFGLRRCTNCGHMTLGTHFDSDSVSAIYTRYYPRRHMDPSTWKPHHEASGLWSWWRGDGANAFRLVPRGVRVLDVGCGWGESIGYYQGRGCEAEGVDADANVAEVARLHNLNIRVGIFHSDNYVAGSFDWVVLDQVLEHMSDPRKTLRQVATVLRPGGSVAIAFPNAGALWRRIFRRRWIHWHAPYHLQFFTPGSFLRLAAQCGFEVATQKTTSPSEWLFYQAVHVWSFPTLGSPSPFWDTAPRSLRFRLMFGVALVLRRCGVFHTLSRLADACGVGDNIVYVLKKGSAHQEG